MSLATTIALRTKAGNHSQSQTCAQGKGEARRSTDPTEDTTTTPGASHTWEERAVDT